MRAPPSDFGAQAPDKARVDTKEAPRWLTYRCSGCGRRSYSGYTASALARVLGASPGMRPDLFCAECNTDTPLDRAELRHGDDDTPWLPPSP